MARHTLSWNGRAVSAAVRAAAAQGLQDAADHLLGEAQAVVPIEEAILERSGLAEVDRGSLTAAVSFDTPYAVRQHEDLSLRHDAGRQAKYLEQPAHRERATLGRLIAEPIRRAL